MKGPGRGTVLVALLHLSGVPKPTVHQAGGLSVGPLTGESGALFCYGSENRFVP